MVVKCCEMMVKLLWNVYKIIYWHIQCSCYFSVILRPLFYLMLLGPKFVVLLFFRNFSKFFSILNVKWIFMKKYKKIWLSKMTKVQNLILPCFTLSFYCLVKWLFKTTVKQQKWKISFYFYFTLILLLF